MRTFADLTGVKKTMESFDIASCFHTMGARSVSGRDVMANGRRVPFDRDKLLRSVQIALRKRPVEPERIDQAVSKIVRELESQGESEVSSEAVGELVMEALRQLDDVAYVRFASVYRNFREAKDFEAVLGELSGEDEGKPVGVGRK